MVRLSLSYPVLQCLTLGCWSKSDRQSVLVRLTCGEGVVLAMEGHGVHWIDLLQLIILQSVTFERIFLLLDLGSRIEVLHSNTALDRTQYKALQLYEPSALLVSQQDWHRASWVSEAVGGWMKLCTMPCYVRGDGEDEREREEERYHGLETEWRGEHRGRRERERERERVRDYQYLLVRECPDAPRLVLKTRVSPLLNVTHVPEVPNLRSERLWYIYTIRSQGEKEEREGDGTDTRQIRDTHEDFATGSADYELVTSDSEGVDLVRLGEGAGTARCARIP